MALVGAEEAFRCRKNAAPEDERTFARDVLADRVDPQAFFGPAAIAQDIAKTAGRLDSAADSAFIDGEHASLASLSGQLLRSHELRVKLGGSISDATQVSLSVSLHDLHQRLDPILGASDSNRQSAARSLLGMRQTPRQTLPRKATHLPRDVAMIEIQPTGTR